MGRYGTVYHPGFGFWRDKQITNTDGGAAVTGNVAEPRVLVPLEKEFVELLVPATAAFPNKAREAHVEELSQRKGGPSGEHKPRIPSPWRQ
jgi:hypothetical protein